MELSKDDLAISVDALSRVAEYQHPASLDFGTTFSPIMYRAVYDGERWIERQVIPYGRIHLDPSSKALHYGQQIFEGLKCYLDLNGTPVLFRPLMNMERMNQSARRLCMTEIPENIFMEGVCVVASLSRSMIPTRSGESLYIRPYMIGVDSSLKLGPSEQYEFFVIASPSAAYHESEMSVFVERDEARASIGGTGNVKIGGNYAAALSSAERVKEFGADQSLWLDPLERRYVDELSGMNLFAVIDGQLITPELSGSILPGITRDSIITLAKSLNFSVSEQKIAIEFLLDSIRDGRCSDLFACGTAAIIAPISSIIDRNYGQLDLPESHQISNLLRSKLLGIQEGRDEDLFEWRYPINDIYALEQDVTR